MIIFTRRPRRRYRRRCLARAFELACARFFTHVARNQEVIRAGTYVHTHVPTAVRGSSLFRRREYLLAGGDEGSGNEEDEKKASGRISGTREIITVCIEYNLAKRMQRIEACLRAQGRAKRHAPSS